MSVLFFICQQVFAVISLLVVIKLFKIPRPSVLRFIGTVVVSEMAMGVAWGFSTLFLPLALIGLLLLVLVFKYLLRVTFLRALGAGIVWCLLLGMLTILSYYFVQQTGLSSL